MVLVGFAVGFRVHSNVFSVIAGMLLVLLFGYAMCWIFATVGLAVGDPETAQAAAFPVLAPLVFASSAFVPVASMPGWLQGWAKNQPVSVTVSAVRDLMLGLPAASDVLKSVVCPMILVRGLPLSVRLYRRRGPRRRDRAAGRPPYLGRQRAPATDSRTPSEWAATARATT